MIGLYLLAFCRIAIGLTFVISSGSKALSFGDFQQTLHRFRLLPATLILPVALLFLGGEILVVLFMIFGGWLLLPGFALAIVLLILFSSALLSVVIRGISTPCNCFGPSQRSVSRIDIWRNLGFLVCALGGYAGAVWSQKAIESLGNIEWVFAGLGAAVFVLIWTQLGELARLLRGS
jgi:hypothetical protein